MIFRFVKRFRNWETADFVRKWLQRDPNLQPFIL